MTRARPSLAGVLWALASAAGCTTVFDYPDAKAESDPATCTNGEDDDLDGKVDCDDPSCDGFCPEDSRAACSNRRDDDGDGLTDASDPRCWSWFSPKLTRCADARGIELVEHFDTVWPDPLEASWHRYGATASNAELEGSAVSQARRSDGSTDGRRDGLIRFSGAAAPRALGTLVATRAFAGSLNGLRLSFAAGVPLGSALSVGLLSIGSSPSRAPPAIDAEPTVSLALDRQTTLGSLNLVVAGTSHSTPLPDDPCDGSPCEHATLTQEGSVLVARVSAEGRAEAILRAPMPPSSSLPPSRLVVRGGLTAGTDDALLDDVRLAVAPDWPCGFEDPQIPGGRCDANAFAAYGHTISVALTPAADYCALIAAGDDAAAPRALTAWRSTDGTVWEPAATQNKPAFLPRAGAMLVGAGIAADADGLHAVIASQSDGKTRLFFADGACDRWSEPTAGPSVDDAEAPSYVVADGRHEVFFTRPPNDSTRRTLWRLFRGASEPELVAELPPNVNAPVSVQRVGDRDLVLAYPTSGAIGAGAALLVVGKSLAEWLPVGAGPLLSLSPRPAFYEGRLAFDDGGVVAAALAFERTGGFVLYSGSSVEGWGPSGSGNALTVGTAPLDPANAAVPRAPVAPASSCGDGVCGPLEDCSTCDTDCPCPGATLLDDAFAGQNEVRLVSHDPQASAVRYLGSEPQGLSWAGGTPAWSVLPLARPLTGDFELSFDVFIGAADHDGWNAPCSMYLGLGTAPGLGARDDATPPSGVFAHLRLTNRCTNRYIVFPSVRGPGVQFSESPPDDSPACVGEGYLAPDARQHVVLRREGDLVTVSVQRRNGCGTVESSGRYAGALPDLPALLAGFGGPSFDGCAEGVGSGTISGVTLRLLDDPGACPAGTEGCGNEPGLVCVDTSRSPEDCGGCDRACSAFETCRDGSCTCGDGPGILECDGVCVDTQTSMDHCGACGIRCAKLCSRGVCDYVYGDCAEPGVIPAEGGRLHVDLARRDDADAATRNCGGKIEAVSNPVILSWTPSKSGQAIVDVDLGGSNYDVILTLTSTPNADCSSWSVCVRKDYPTSSRILTPVVSGTTYLISVGLVEPRGNLRSIDLLAGVVE